LKNVQNEITVLMAFYLASRKLTF